MLSDNGMLMKLHFESRFQTSFDHEAHHEAESVEYSALSDFAVRLEQLLQLRLRCLIAEVSNENLHHLTKQ